MAGVPNSGTNATVPAAWGDSITPSTEVMARQCRAVYVGVAGHLVVRHVGTTGFSTYENVAAGAPFPVQADMIMAYSSTAATAGKLVAMG